MQIVKKIVSYLLVVAVMLASMDAKELTQQERNAIAAKLIPIYMLLLEDSTPKITGTPKGSVNVFGKYSFLPTLSNAEKKQLLFTIENMPSWAEFDPDTGLLHGVPLSEDIGTFSNIKISVEHNEKKISLSAFSIEVLPAVDIAHLYGMATQGSGAWYARAEHNASMGIDGNSSTYIYTDGGTQSWYQVEIPKGYEVYKLMIQSGSYKPYRLNGAKVYVSNTPYNNTVNGLEEVGTLKGDTSEQIIQFNPPKEIKYVIVKGTDKLHIATLEIYGGHTSFPVFDNTKEYIEIKDDIKVGSTITTVNAIDYQGDSITYSIVGNVPFSIDNIATIKSTTSLIIPNGLDYENYHFEVSASDGLHSRLLPVDINVTKVDLARKYGVAIQGSGKGYRYYHAPKNVLDGDINTYNHTDGGKWGYNWLQVRLPSPTSFSKILIQSRLTGEQEIADRIGGAKVYLSNTPYKTGDTPDENALIATLQPVVTPQIIKLDPSKQGTYLLIKGAYSDTSDKHLHLSRVEVYGALPQAPTIDNDSFEITIDKWQGKAESIFDVNSTDYQDDPISYALVDTSHFKIDAQGHVYVNSFLNMGLYNVDINVSDGLHSYIRRVTVNVINTPQVRKKVDIKDRTPSLHGYLPNTYQDGDIVKVIIDGKTYIPTINSDGTWSLDGDNIDRLSLGKHDLILQVGGTSITYPNYFDIYGDRFLSYQIPFSNMPTISSVDINVTSSSIDYPEFDEYFRGSDIHITVENNITKVINKSYKKYRSVWVKYTDGNGNKVFKILRFDKAIEPHTVNEVKRFAHDENITIVNTAGLFDLELGFGGFNYSGTYCTEEILAQDYMVYCMPLHYGQENLIYRPDAQGVTQQEGFDVIMGTYNNFYNSVEAYPAMEAWMNMKPYKGTGVVSFYTDDYVKELNAYNREDYVSTQFYEAVLPNDKIRMTILQHGGGGVLGRGNGDPTPLGQLTTTNWGYISMVDYKMSGDPIPGQKVNFDPHMYDSVHHESMHAKEYSHESGMTYGWSTFVGNYLQWNPNKPYEVKVNPEAIVPKYMFDMKKLSDNQLQLTLYNKNGMTDKDLTIEILSSTYLNNGDISVEKSATDANNQITITVHNGIKTRLIIRVYGDDSWEVMSKFVTFNY